MFGPLSRKLASKYGHPSNTTPKRKRYKYTSVRQWGGDDGYCWAVFVKGSSTPKVCGLTKPEVAYYRDRIEAEEASKHGK